MTTTSGLDRGEGVEDILLAVQRLRPKVRSSMEAINALNLELGDLRRFKLTWISRHLRNSI